MEPSPPDPQPVVEVYADRFGAGHFRLRQPDGSTGPAVEVPDGLGQAYMAAERAHPDLHIKVLIDDGPATGEEGPSDLDPVAS